MTDLASIVTAALNRGLIQKPATTQASTKSQLASVRWHRDRRQGFKVAGLNAHGRQFKNSRRTSGKIVHDDIPAKAYRDHTRYMRLWREKQRQLRATMKTHNVTITNDQATELRLMRDEFQRQIPRSKTQGHTAFGTNGVAATDSTRDLEHKVSALDAVLKQCT